MGDAELSVETTPSESSNFILQSTVLLPKGKTFALALCFDLALVGSLSSTLVFLFPWITLGHPGGDQMQ